MPSHFRVGEYRKKEHALKAQQCMTLSASLRTERQSGSRPLEKNHVDKCRCSNIYICYIVYCIYYCSYIFLYVFRSVLLAINHKNVYTIVLFSRYIYLYTKMQKRGNSEDDTGFD